MIGGPVLAAELRRAARRPRVYAARAGLALILLVLLGLGYAGSVRSDEVSGAELTSLATSAFTVLAVAQGVAVAVFTPALVAGSIPEERSRKTLDDLLGSDLSAREIVLGKLGARLAQIVGLIAVGLPIAAGLTLFGGVEPWRVAMTFVVIAALAVFLGGVAILVSVLSRGPREAVFTAYGVSAFLLLIGPMIERPFRDAWPGPYRAIAPIAYVLGSFNPLLVDWDEPASCAIATAGLAVLGVAFSTLAVLLFRSAARREPRPRREPRRARPRFRRLKRPPVNDDPMRWKETRTRGRVGLLGRVLAGGASLVALGFAVVAVQKALPAFTDAINYGYGRSVRMEAAETLNDFLRWGGVVVYLLALLGATAHAAGSITGEREADTWTGILASPLTNAEILRGKRAGAVRKVRPLVVALLAMWTLGVLAGAIHTFGFAVCLLMVAVYLRSAASVGAMTSLHARNTGMALLIAMIATIFLHGGYMLCCVFLARGEALVAAGVSPVLVYLAPTSYGGLERDLQGRTEIGGVLVATVLASITFYVALAAILNTLAANSLDSAEDRPDAEGVSGPPIPPSGAVPERS